MAGTKAGVLVVDDEPMIRTSLSLILAQIGYLVRSAGDGFSALAELQKEIPTILISDLNMPGMNGFELLSQVRRRFPSVQTIAMSGAFSGDAVPSGVVADAFYSKSSGVGFFLSVMESLPRLVRMSPDHPEASAPILDQPSEAGSCGGC